MSRRFSGVFALAILATLSSHAFSPAKPPDLPDDLIITVAPVCPGCPDRQPARTVDAVACPTVLENLERLLEAGDRLEKAQKHFKAGEHAKALECVSAVRQLVPGSSLERQCDEIVLALRPTAGGEEACEGPCCCPCLTKAMQAAHCWVAWATQTVKVKSASKADLADKLLEVAHKAAVEGHMTIAADLVRQAHSLSPERVAADPLVYKMHLLDLKPVKGGEEASEPLPDHPRQKR